MSRMAELETSCPMWVKYIAQDKDGAWYGYECYPSFNGQEWIPTDNGVMVHIMDGESSEDWQDKVYEVYFDYCGTMIVLDDEL